jgi:hypothetical protein
MTSFIDHQPGGNRVRHAGIRDLLRDTALLVTTLSQGGKTESITVLRQRCQQLMSGFSTALEQRGVAADVKEDALNAQCGLLDEAVLPALPMDDKPHWGAQPLQVERNGRHDAGEHVFDRLTARMREATNADLLEGYAAIPCRQRGTRRTGMACHRPTGSQARSGLKMWCGLLKWKSSRHRAILVVSPPVPHRPPHVLQRLPP